MEFIEKSCRWCGEEKYDVVVKGPDLLTGLPGSFQFVKCNNCGLLRQNPYLNWKYLMKYYPDDYSSYQPQVPDVTSKQRQFDKRYGLWKRVKLVSKYKPTGKWIDVGAGTGRVLQEAMRWETWDLMGIEPVERAAEYIKIKTGLQVFGDRLEKFSGYENTFDIVTMWDVLEHFEDPIMAINKVREILRENGIYVFSIPNIKSWDLRVFKNYWVGYDLPRHLHLFSDVFLSTIMKKKGFKIIEKKCIAGSHGALMLDLLFLSRASKKSKLLEVVTSINPDAYIPRALTFIPLWIFDKLKMGTNITCVTQKITK